MATRVGGVEVAQVTPSAVRREAAAQIRAEITRPQGPIACAPRADDDEVELVG